MKKRFLTLGLATAVLLTFIFTYTFAANSSTANTWSAEFEPINGTSGATLKVQGPSTVYLGDSFDVTFQWKNIDFGNYPTGSIDIYFYFDARFIEIPASAVSVTELDAALWKSIGTDSVPASSSSSADMKLMKVAIAIPKNNTVSDTLTAVVTFNAVALGVSEFDWDYAAISAYADESFKLYCEVANATENTYVDLDYSVTVVAKPDSDTSIPDSEDTTVPDTEDTTAPDTEDTTTPDTEDTTAPDTEDTTTPDTEDTTAPDTEDTTTPDTEDTTAPDTEDTTAPDTEDTTTPDTDDTTAPDSDDTTTPDSEDTTAPDSEDTTVPKPDDTTSPSPDTSDNSNRATFVIIAVCSLAIIAITTIQGKKKKYN